MEATQTVNENDMPAVAFQPEAELDFRFHSEAYDVHSLRLGEAQKKLEKNPSDDAARLVAKDAAMKVLHHLHCLYHMAADRAAQC